MVGPRLAWGCDVDVDAVADLLHERIAVEGRPDRAVHERAYLKSDLEFLGASVPAIRRITRTTRRDLDTLDHDVLVALVRELWSRGVHELRMAAVELLEVEVAHLSPDDVPLLEDMVREARTWALVDPLAADVTGHLDQAFPAAMDPVVRRWAADDDVWLRRASLLVHLRPLRRGDGDPGRFLELADDMLDEPVFWIRKAIGWVLRDLGRQRPDVVVAWLAPRVHRAAGLTVREAVKHLPAADRDRLLDARKART